ncbi:MAG: glycerol-3-phosphate dehydrogenase [Pseudomonadota bacterium]
MISAHETYDLCIVGGGVNGCGIARDAAGRGLSVYLCEMKDLAQATSSASTKLFHGGLRYLENYEFRMVRESLIEREVLLGAMPHISWPLRFVLPHHKGLRPAWLLRLGLFIYDNLGGRKILPGTRTLDLSSDVAGAPLKNTFAKAFEYSDCWVEDSRLVVLNARDAADRGAMIETRTRFASADVVDGMWDIQVDSAERGPRRIRAKAIVNAGGPWAEDVARNGVRQNKPEKLRLVRGSHIVVRKLFDHDKSYIFQHSDGRIVFAIPYEADFTLIGTTDAEHKGDPSTAVCTPEEADYLRTLASEYFETPITADDTVWSYAGVRPLIDDGAASASKTTRDYVLKFDTGQGAPLLNIFGGKITTYRKLAEEALSELAPVFPDAQRPWTAGAAMPGGDFPVDGFDRLCEALVSRHPWLDPVIARRLARAYGTDAAAIIGGAERFEDLGEHFGAGLTEAELRHLMHREWARTADDVIWRRSKLGLRLNDDQKQRLQARMEEIAAGEGQRAAE